ncbi:VanW family protein [Georgenia yuyongxinii]
MAEHASDAQPFTEASQVDETTSSTAVRAGVQDAAADTVVMPAPQAPAAEPEPASEVARPTEPSAPAEPAASVVTPAGDAAPAVEQPTERFHLVEETAMPATSPLAVFPAEAKPDERTRRRGRRGLIVASIVVGVLAIAYVAGAWFLGDRVPGGTVVAGVPIGGLAEEQARERLQTELADLQSEPVPVTIGAEAIATIDPAAANLRLDVDATLKNLVGFSFAPQTMWDHLFGGGEAPAVSTADDDALRTAVEAAAGTLNLAPVEGSISYVGTTPQPTEPAAGKAVDVDAAQNYLLTRWLADERPLELPITEAPPQVGADAVDEAMSTLAEPLVSGPVAVSVEGQLAQLTPETLAANATFVSEGGSLALKMDGAALAHTVHEVNPETGVAGEDAKIVLNADAQPEIVPSTSGRGLDPEALASAVATAGTSTNRTAVVGLVDAEPEFTTADAEALGVKEIVADFSTPMPYDPVRTRNLQVGAEKITGVLVMPGEEFSLLEALGPITAANGFVSSGVVEDGFSSTALGGGLSQLSTNMFNVGLIAGMDDVEHKPHSRWFSRYPAGREATLWEPTVDMVWRNNTDYGILVHAWVTSNAVHTRLWSTKVWDVDITTSSHYNITQPTTVYDPDEPCVAESGGQYGFTVTVTRERSRAGQAPESQDWTWTYQPWNRVVCGEKPAPEPEPTPSASPAA